MNPLTLSPLPVVRSDDESVSLLMEREGFVDEAVVRAIMCAPLHQRSNPFPEDLALAADDMDFAGWQLSPTLPARSAESSTLLPAGEFPVRRAAPPVAEPGLGSPHYGNHRWWLAGLAGVLSTMLFSVLLISLSVRSGSQFDRIVSPRFLTTAKPPVAPVADSAETTPELTDISNHRH